jgi:hypothetical protein
MPQEQGTRIGNYANPILNFITKEVRNPRTDIIISRIGKVHTYELLSVRSIGINPYPSNGRIVERDEGETISLH